MTRVPFGIHKDGRLIDAASANRGLACDCICPECRQPLIAKKGTEHVAHFAHNSLEDCVGGAETALHLAAKQIVVDGRRLNLPPLPVEVSKSDPVLGLFKDKAVFEANAKWLFETIASEVAIGPLRADIAGQEIHNGFAAVEILVSHAVDAAKAQILSARRVPCVEVKLSELVGKMLTMHELAWHVLERTDNKTWIYHPRESHYKRLLMGKYPEWRSARERQHLDYLENKKQLDEKQQREDERLRKLNLDRQKRETQLASEKIAAAWKTLDEIFGPARDRWPRQIGLQLRDGARAFSVPQDLWQGLLFCRFIAETKKGRRMRNTLPSDEQIVRDIADQLGSGLNMASTRTAVIAVRLYLGYLRQCGFLEQTINGYAVTHDGLYPPKRSTSDIPLIERRPALTKPQASLWRKVWPEREKILNWAIQHASSKMSSDFNAPDFVGALLSYRYEPDEQEMHDMIDHFGGDPSDLLALLSAMGVSSNSFRILSWGNPPPWSAGC